MEDVRVYDLTNSWENLGSFKENVVNLAMAVVMNTTDTHIIPFLSNNLGDEAEWSVKEFADNAKLCEECEIPKGRVSDQRSLIVWRTESETSCKVHQGETEVVYVDWEGLQSLPYCSVKRANSLLKSYSGC